MADLDTGSTDYPGSLDTNPTPQTGSDNTNHLSVVGSQAAVIAVQGELGTTPSQDKTTVKAYLQTEHDSGGEHTFKIPHTFFQDNVAANQSAVALIVVGSATVDEIEVPWAGSIVGISVLSNESRSAGSLTVDATINGSVTGLQAVLNASNADHHSATQVKDTDAFAAADRIGIKITTDAGWLPTTADIIVVIYVSFNS